MFQMCTGSTLFKGRANDTLDEDNLRILAAWSEADAKARTAEIRNRTARNLVARLLRPDPKDRLSVKDVLQHPFLTKETVRGRLKGEDAFYDLFIGYRVATDRQNVKDLFYNLTSRGFRVFWDALCLKDGRDWEEGFCDGLVHSKVFVPLLSHDALYKEGRQNISQLAYDSKCDNVVLEHAMALELRERELIEGIHPVLMNNVSADNAPDLVVADITKKLAQHLRREDLGEMLLAEPNVRYVPPSPICLFVFVVCLFVVVIFGHGDSDSGDSNFTQIHAPHVGTPSVISWTTSAFPVI